MKINDELLMAYPDKGTISDDQIVTIDMKMGTIRKMKEITRLALYPVEGNKPLIDHSIENNKVGMIKGHELRPLTNITDKQKSVEFNQRMNQGVMVKKGQKWECILDFGLYIKGDIRTIYNTGENFKGDIAHEVYRLENNKTSFLRDSVLRKYWSLRTSKIINPNEIENLGGHDLDDIGARYNITRSFQEGDTVYGERIISARDNPKPIDATMTI